LAAPGAAPVVPPEGAVSSQNAYAAGRAAHPAARRPCPRRARDRYSAPARPRRRKPAVPETPAPTQPLVVYFDGVCNFCNGVVDFLMRRDRRGALRFASLQGETSRARGIVEAVGGLDTIVVEDGARRLVRSDAALRLATALGGAWRLLAVLRLVPRPLRDAVYRFIARNRYRWFGTRSTCRLPTASERERFLP
jgi:predicted DCC family thiol-disulfide oxidoreductase YuxK